MKTIQKYMLCLFIISLTTIVYSCKKQDDFLNVKKNNSDVVPSTVANFQALLDNDGNMNQLCPTLGLIGVDNYYFPDYIFAAIAGNPPFTTGYIWQSDIWQNNQSYEWNYCYQNIEYANAALDGVNKVTITTDNLSAYNNVKGSALFYRAFYFYNLAALFAKPYIANTAANDLGIPLRTNSDITIKSVRSSVQDTYKQIIGDLTEASNLLPQSPLVKTRPSVLAANALLAKVYLSMEDYTNAAIYANKVLSVKSDLMDYNNTSLVNQSASVPFPKDMAKNPEIIFYGSDYYAASPLGPGNGLAVVDSDLYKSYNNADLRKLCLFDSTPSFKGSYSGNTSIFCGIAINEIYLIRAECNARSGNINVAMADLNKLLINRYKTGSFTPLTATTTDGALSLILSERRKELPFTSFLRWEDLRRLNKDSKYAITLKRVINGTTYTLPPNDSKYVYPIPNNEIQLSGIPQNPR